MRKKKLSISVVENSRIDAKYQMKSPFHFFVNAYGDVQIKGFFSLLISNEFDHFVRHPISFIFMILLIKKDRDEVINYEKFEKIT